LLKESDVLWLRLPSAVAVFFWWAARKQRKPVILHVSGNILLSPGSPKYKGLLRFVALIGAYAVHLLTRWMSRYGITLVTGGELKELFSTSLYPAYLLDDISLSESDLHAPVKIKKQATELLFVGRLDYGKGIEILLQTIEELREEFPHIRLRLAGSGPLLDSMQKLIAERKLQDNVELLGFVSASASLQGLYRDADIFILPSDSCEGFPRVILEAWGAGLPVLATRLGGIPYRIRHGENGLLVKPGDKDGLRDALRELLSDGELRYRLARTGFETVKSLTFERQALHIRELLNRYYPHLGIRP